MRQVSEVLIAMGSNLGSRESYIAQAAQALAAHNMHLIKASNLYMTQPIGNADKMFLNAAVIASTDLEPEDCMQRLLAIETSLGRQRSVHWGNRTIDLDIIMWRRAGTYLSHASTSLVIPHPRCIERDFVLVPCAAIASDWLHPTYQCSLGALQIEQGHMMQPFKKFPEVG